MRRFVFAKELILFAVGRKKETCINDKWFVEFVVKESGPNILPKEAIKMFFTGSFSTLK